jgi:putative ABC transport system permease protein
VWHLAWRNLMQSRARLVMSTGGVALALSLILALDAIVTGMEGQLAAYIERSGADIWVSQAGVRNLHMAFSSLPRAVMDELAAVSGVASATPILYVTHPVVMGGDSRAAYIIGLPPDATAGGPWGNVIGASRPAPGGVIVDLEQAESSGVTLGESVRIFGRQFQIVGLAEGTASLLNSVAFIALEDFARLRRSQEVVSYVLVQVSEGESPEVIAGRIEAAIEGVTAQSREAFAAQERKIIKDMGVEAVTILNLVGFLIGLAVMALTVYTATLARRAEYGVLKALGARNSHLYRAVTAQAFYSVALGFLLAVVFTLALGVAAPQLGLKLAVELSWASLLKVGLISLAIAGMAAALPIRQIAGLDPAMVFKGGRG